MAGGYDPRASEREDVSTRLRLDRYLLSHTGPPRHVWVRVEREGRKTMLPGVLVAWKLRDGVWTGHVAWADEQERLTVEWLPADLLRPVSGTPAPPPPGTR